MCKSYKHTASLQKSYNRPQTYDAIFTLINNENIYKQSKEALFHTH